MEYTHNNLLYYSKLEDLFRHLFPTDLFRLVLGGQLSIFPTFGTNKSICVYSPYTLFHVTHEMAHIIETPNARIFSKNFGLKFPEYSVMGNRVVTSSAPYKTEVPFKRELRVFGIQRALLFMAKEKFGFDEDMTREHVFRENVKRILVGVSVPSCGFVFSRYIPFHKRTSATDLFREVHLKLFEYGEEYHHTKLPKLLERKFDYMRKHRNDE